MIMTRKIPLIVIVLISVIFFKPSIGIVTISSSENIKIDSAQYDEVFSRQYYQVNSNSIHSDLESPFFNVTEIQNDADWQTAWGLTSNDFNNDGKMDFAASYADSPFLFARISIFYNNGNNTYTRDQVFQFQYTYISSLISGDFTNDGYIDLIFSYSNWIVYQGLCVKINGSINILINDGTNHFKPKKEIARLTGPDIPYDPLNRINPKLTCADYDQDGDLDFIVGDNRGAVELYLNNGTGNFTCAGFIAEYKDLEGDRGLSWGVTSADFDADGDCDFLVGVKSTDCIGNVWYHQNMLQESNGTVLFQQDSGQLITELHEPLNPWGTVSLAAIDYDNDGTMDFLAGAGNIIYLYTNRNPWEGIYAYKLPDGIEGYLDHLAEGGMTVADYDNDGYSDAIIGGVQGFIREFTNAKTLAVITRPKNTYWYKFDEEQYQLFKDNGILCVGRITLHVSPVANLTKVDFYINGILRTSDTTKPYEYIWRFSFPLSFYHTVRIVAYDQNGRQSVHEIKIWRTGLCLTNFVVLFSIFNTE